MTAQTPERDARGEAHPLDLPAMAAYGAHYGIDGNETLAEWRGADEQVRAHFRAIADAVRMIDAARPEHADAGHLRQLLRDARPHVARNWREHPDPEVRANADEVLARMTEAGIE